MISESTFEDDYAESGAVIAVEIPVAINGVASNVSLLLNKVQTRGVTSSYGSIVFLSSFKNSNVALKNC